MTQKNVSTAGDRYPAIRKTSRTYKYKRKVGSAHVLIQIYIWGQAIVRQKW